MFEDVRRERLLILILSLTYPEILKKSGFMDHEINRKNNAFQKIQSKTLEKYVAL